MKIGRPQKYKTPQELEKVLQKYFDNTKSEEWTITGLALLIGGKQLLQDYQKRDGYSELVIRAKLMVENSYEISLRSSNRTPAGAIFALKNLGWTDQQHIIHDISYSEKSDEELIDRANKILATRKESGAE